MKNQLFLLIVLFSSILLSQEKEKIIFIFDEINDTIINNNDNEFYKLAKYHSFKYDKIKHKKNMVKFDIIIPNVSKYNEFISSNKHKKFPDFFSDYSIFIFVREDKNTGCLIEVEKIWLVEDKIIN